LVDDRKTEEPFLQRWARRKTDAAKPAAEQAAPETPEPKTIGVDMRTTETAALPQSSDAPAEDERDESQEIDLSTLPDIDSLDADSDFSVFLQNGIPEELQKRALQKLWRLDPALGHIDGLLEYGEDFTGSGLIAEAVDTVYKVGKGMRTGDAEEAEDRAAEDAAEVGAADATDAATDMADERPDRSHGGPPENADDPENDVADIKEPDRIARRRDPHRDQ
jgi:hypothetical protein